MNIYPLYYVNKNVRDKLLTYVCSRALRMAYRHMPFFTFVRAVCMCVLLSKHWTIVLFRRKKLIGPINGIFSRRYVNSHIAYPHSLFYL